MGGGDMRSGATEVSMALSYDGGGSSGSDFCLRGLDRRGVLTSSSLS